jgi:hypothetical protein
VIFVPNLFGHGTYNVQESVGVAVELPSSMWKQPAMRNEMKEKLMDQVKHPQGWNPTKWQST